VGGRIRGKKGKNITLCNSDDANTNLAYCADTTKLLMIFNLGYKRGNLTELVKSKTKIEKNSEKAKQ
jgi:hypothetical protein